MIKTMKAIETKRLVVREFDKGDFLSVHSYASAKVLEKIGMNKEGGLRGHKYQK